MLKSYDVISCLSKNLITRFILYIEREKRYNIETLLTDRVFNKENFYGKSCKNVHQKLYPYQNPFLKLVSAIFSKFLFFHQMIALQKPWKMLFISSKKLFLFSRYSIFCISVLPSFSTCRPLLWRMIKDKSSSSWCHQLSK